MFHNVHQRNADSKPWAQALLFASTAIGTFTFSFIYQSSRAQVWSGIIGNSHYIGPHTKSILFSEFGIRYTNITDKTTPIEGYLIEGKRLFKLFMLSLTLFSTLYHF